MKSKRDPDRDRIIAAARGFEVRFAQDRSAVFGDEGIDAFGHLDLRNTPFARDGEHELDAGFGARPGALRHREQARGHDADGGLLGLCLMGEGAQPED